MSNDRDKKDAERWRALKELCGYFENATETSVHIDHDDATRTTFIKAGKKTYYREGCGIDSAIEKVIKEQRGGEQEAQQE